MKIYSYKIATSVFIAAAIFGSSLLEARTIDVGTAYKTRGELGGRVQFI